MLNRTFYLLFASLFFALCTLSCNQKESVSPSISTGSSYLGKLTAEGAVLTKSDKSLHPFFTSRFAASEISLVEIREHPKKGYFYLYAEGIHNAPDAVEGALIVMRWEVEEKDGNIDFIKKPTLDKNDGNGGSSNSPGGVGESCTGAPCSECKFNDPPQGGCWCARSEPGEESKCNHTITRD